MDKECDVCVYKIDRVLSTEEKNSGSNTVIAFGTNDAQMIAIKAFFSFSSEQKDRLKGAIASARPSNDNLRELQRYIDYHVDLQNKLVIEVQIYTTILNKIFKKACHYGVCGNFVKMICSKQVIRGQSLFKCNFQGKKGDEYRQALNKLYKNSDLSNKWFITFLNGMNPKARQILHQDWTGNSIAPDRFNYVVTERINRATSLYEYFHNNKKLIREDRDCIKCIMLQILNALNIMNIVGIQHNDMHLGNILIAPPESSNQEFFKYRPFQNDVYFKVPVKYGIIKVFDWDFGVCFGSSKAECFYNKYLETQFCEKIGICAFENPKFDLYLVCRGVYEELGNIGVSPTSSIRTFLNRITSNTYKEDERFEGRLCLSPPNSNKCGNKTVPNEVMSVQEALMNQYFVRFREPFAGSARPKTPRI